MKLDPASYWKLRFLNLHQQHREVLAQMAIEHARTAHAKRYAFALELGLEPNADYTLDEATFEATRVEAPPAEKE
jgi:hypothetical protein